MRVFDVEAITASEGSWPGEINQRLGRSAPSRLWTTGNLAILSEHKLALFSSVDCPPDVAESARNAIHNLTNTERAFISGFHSPVEKDCLRMFLESEKNVIISVAHSLEQMRVPTEWYDSLDKGRLLIVSRFERTRRADKHTTRQRNELVAALANEVLIFHASPGGAIARVADLINCWQIPMRKLDAMPKTPGSSQ